MTALPMRCHAYVQSRGHDVVAVEENGQKGIVFRNFLLPPGRFERATADILIFLPSGYPDAAPDMFYADPWLRLTPSGQCPRAADVSAAFVGKDWQRWSRHNTSWRPGVDGIWTMLKRIETALTEAV